MKTFLRLFALVIVTLGVAGTSIAAPASDPENTLYLDTAYGRVVIQMRPDLAPKTVAQVKSLARKGFYNGLVFHRVIAEFMAQTGDPNGNGSPAAPGTRSRPSSAARRLCAARWGWRGLPTPTAPTASSSSASPRRLTSTANTRCGAR